MARGPVWTITLATGVRPAGRRVCSRGALAAAGTAQGGVRLSRGTPPPRRPSRHSSRVFLPDADLDARSRTGSPLHAWERVRARPNASEMSGPTRNGPNGTPLTSTTGRSRRGDDGAGDPVRHGFRLRLTLDKPLPMLGEGRSPRRFQTRSALSFRACSCRSCQARFLAASMSFSSTRQTSSSRSGARHSATAGSATSSPRRALARSRSTRGPSRWSPLVNLDRGSACSVDKETQTDA